MLQAQEERYGPPQEEQEHQASSLGPWRLDCRGWQQGRPTPFVAEQLSAYRVPFHAGLAGSHRAIYSSFHIPLPLFFTVLLVVDLRLVRWVIVGPLCIYVHAAPLTPLHRHCKQMRYGRCSVCPENADGRERSFYAYAPTPRSHSRILERA